MRCLGLGVQLVFLMVDDHFRTVTTVGRVPPEVKRDLSRQLLKYGIFHIGTEMATVKIVNPALDAVRLFNQARHAAFLAIAKRLSIPRTCSVFSPALIAAQASARCSFLLR